MQYKGPALRIFCNPSEEIFFAGSEKLAGHQENLVKQKKEFWQKNARWQQQREFARCKSMRSQHESGLSSEFIEFSNRGDCMEMCRQLYRDVTKFSLSFIFNSL
jgi:hypothetical protein